MSDTPEVTQPEIMEGLRDAAIEEVGQAEEAFNAENPSLETQEDGELKDILDGLEESELELSETQEETEEHVDTKSKILAKARKFESENIQLRNEIKEYEKYPEVLGAQLKEFAEQKPLEFINAFYTTEQKQQLVMEILGSTDYNIPDEDEPEHLTIKRELEGKLTSLEQKILERERQEQEYQQNYAKQQEQAQLQDAFIQIDNSIDPSETPLLARLKNTSSSILPRGAHREVLETAVLIWKETGVRPDYKEVAKVVEKVLEEDLASLSPQEQREAAHTQRSTATLSSQHGTTQISSQKNMTLDELREAALRSIQFLFVSKTSWKQ